MSRQSSNISDKPDVPRPTGGSNRKGRDWAVWYRPGAKTLERMPSWVKWSRLGKYASKEIAEGAAARNGLASAMPDWQFIVRHVSEGRPDEAF